MTEPIICQVFLKSGKVLSPPAPDSEIHRHVEELVRRGANPWDLSIRPV